MQPIIQIHFIHSSIRWKNLLLLPPKNQVIMHLAIGVYLFCTQEFATTAAIWISIYLTTFCVLTQLVAVKLNPKNAEHYFLRCHKHTIQRLVLFNSLRIFLPLRLETLLYGNPNLTDAENKTIFESVYIFIKNSNRFDWFTLTIINIQTLKKSTSYKIKQNKTLGIWTLNHTDITTTKSVQSLILISITINNIISLAHFKKTIIITLFLKKWAATRDFQQYGILRSVDWGGPVRPSVKRGNFKWYSVGGTAVMEYSSD